MKPNEIKMIERKMKEGYDDFRKHYCISFGDWDKLKKKLLENETKKI